MLLSLLALLATAGVAYMGAVLGPYRTTVTLVAFIIAGTAGFGLMGPVAGALGADNHDSVWYFAGDAVALWAVTAAVFLALRTVGQRLLPQHTQLPIYVERSAGAVVGLGLGYLIVGLCTILLQMLPTGPEVLGYEAFRYEAAQRAGQADRVEPTASPLWLRWDRGTLAFFGYLTWCPLGPVGSDDGSLFDRCGDTYPPARSDYRGPDYKPRLNADDVLYYYWYRRYDYILWRVGRATGPVPEPIRSGQSNGVPLAPSPRTALQGLAVSILSVDRSDAVDGFNLRSSSNENFVRVRVSVSPIGTMPRPVDTDQFVLLESDGNRVTRPHVLLWAKTAGGGQYEVSREALMHASDFQAREPQYSFVAGQTTGQCLAEGARMKFAETSQSETFTLIFSVTKRRALSDIRLNVEPGSEK